MPGNKIMSKPSLTRFLKEPYTVAWISYVGRKNKVIDPDCLKHEVKLLRLRIWLEIIPQSET